MASNKTEWAGKLRELIEANPGQKAKWYAEQLGLKPQQVHNWMYNNLDKDGRSGLSQEDRDRMHEAIEKKAITTPEELSAEAAVTVEQAKRYLKEQKLKIQNAVADEEEAMHKPLTVSSSGKSHEPSKAEMLKAVEEARKERDEWRHRWELAKSKEGNEDYIDRLRKKLNELTDELAATNSAMADQVRTVDMAIAQRDDAVQRMSAAIVAKDELIAQRDALAQENDELRARLKDVPEAAGGELSEVQRLKIILCDMFLEGRQYA